MQKKCSSCRELKDLSFFGVDKSSKDGLGYYCKQCAINKSRAWQINNKIRASETKKRYAIENKERIASKKLEYYHKNKEHADKKTLEWRRKNKERVYARSNELKRERRKRGDMQEKEKNRKLKKKYGITIEDYKKMVLAQDNLCAICGSNSDKKSLHVDHCHKTGKVRELLCARCNTTLGRLNDDINLIKKMSLYLQRHLTPLALDSGDSPARKT